LVRAVSLPIYDPCKMLTPKVAKWLLDGPGDIPGLGHYVVIVMTKFGEYRHDFEEAVVEETVDYLLVWSPQVVAVFDLKQVLNYHRGA